MSTSKAPTSAGEELSANIGDILSNLVAGMDSENDERLAALASNGLIATAEAAIADRDPEAFWYALEYRVSGVIRAMLRRSFPKSPEARFLFEEYSFVRCHFRNLFQKHEGSACCNDKAGMVLRKLLRFYLDGTPIVFDRTAKYTYALPTKIFTKHDEIVEFFNALRFLSCGRPDQFVEQLLSIEAQNCPADGDVATSRT